MDRCDSGWGSGMHACRSSRVVTHSMIIIPRLESVYLLSSECRAVQGPRTGDVQLCRSTPDAAHESVRVRTILIARCDLEHHAAKGIVRSETVRHNKGVGERRTTCHHP